MKSIYKKGFIANFFFKQLSAKKPKSDSSDSKKFIWYARYLSGICYFKLDKEYQKFITWITQYYPFSLLYRDKLIHAKNQTLMKFVNKMEDLASKSKMKILITGNYYEEPMFNFDVSSYETISEESVKQYEELLQKEFGNIYVRLDAPQKLRIIIPHDTLDFCLSKMKSSQ